MTIQVAYEGDGRDLLQQLGQSPDGCLVRHKGPGEGSLGGAYALQSHDWVCLGRGGGQGIDYWCRRCRRYEVISETS